MPHFSRPDAEIYYEEHGQGEPLILSYGLAGNTSLWGPQTKHISKDYRLVLWDQRGHGRSSSPTDVESYGLWKSVDDLHALLDHLDIEGAHIGGQSMGAGVAARFALQHPDRTNSLLIIDSQSASGLKSSPERDMRRTKKLQLAEREGMHALAELALKEDPNVLSRLRACASRTEEVREEVRQMFCAMNVRGFINSTVALASADDISGRLQEIDKSTILIAGEFDPALPAMTFVHSQIRNSILKIVRQAGHYSNLDNPTEFNAVLLSCLGQSKNAKC